MAKFKDALCEALDEGVIDKEQLINAFVGWISDDALGEMLWANQILIGPHSEDNEGEDDE